MTDIRTIAWDPGTINFAYAFRVNGEIVEDGFMETINGVDDDAKFLNFAIELLVRLKPNKAVAERYMHRGMESRSSEYVNQMIAKLDILVRIYCGIDLELITPAQWKAYFKKKTGVKKGEKFNSMNIYPDAKAEHVADARCMARYVDEYWV